jgi:hypothetical protein
MAASQPMNTSTLTHTKTMKGIHDEALGQIDAFSMMNLQRGMTMDLMVADFDGGLKSTLRDGGIKALGLMSDNFKVMADVLGIAASTIADNSDSWKSIFSGDANVEDYFWITNSIVEQLY